MDKNDNLKIDDKLVFKKDIRFPVGYDIRAEVKVNIGDKINPGAMVAGKSSITKTETINYKGVSTLKAGDILSPGDVIATHGKIKKKHYLSEIHGKVIEVNEESVKVEILYKDDEVIEVHSLFGGEVELILADKVIIKFSGTQLNMLDSKGESSTGKLKYISSSEFEQKENIPSNLNDVIVVTDRLTAEIYPIVSTLGAKGIIANCVDYYLYQEMIILAVPVGIISGFGKCEEDSKIKTILKTAEQQSVWFDSENCRLVVPETKEPEWIKNYKFDLSILGIT